MLVLFIYITRLASNEISSPSNKIHREVGRAKDLSAPRHLCCVIRKLWCHIPGVIKSLDVFSSERLCLSVASTMIRAPHRVFTVDWECHK